MENVTEERTEKEYHDQVYQLIPKIRKALSHVNGNLGWIACQQNSKGDWYGVCFVMGDEAGFFSYQELDTKSEDELALIGAERIIGFPVGSDEDKERQRIYYKELIASSNERLMEISSDIVRFETLLNDLEDSEVE